MASLMIVVLPWKLPCLIDQVLVFDTEVDVSLEGLLQMIENSNLSFCASQLLFYFLKFMSNTTNPALFVFVSKKFSHEGYLLCQFVSLMKPSVFP